MNEFRVKVSIRNNLILSAVEEAGYAGWGGITRFCADSGISQGEFAALVSFRRAPLTKDGEFSNAAKALMEALGAAPSDLWTDKQLVLSLARNSSESTACADSINSLLLEKHQEAMTLPNPEDVVNDGMTKALINKVLGTLSPYHAKVLKLRFGLDGMDEHTLDEVGDIFGVTKERIRQIEVNAFRKFRGPLLSSKLLDAYKESA